ncbi:MAG: hypothetical protein A2498_07735 [Lentisphaerae bacterium RIFOXYC12_FULL_60_16]|nr:MAG: hypothetical protein A2498_07735 [Lentisphaerae bacterium RIFOXYC12_FULL_60_16]OGV83520.1 MAG: hypothetical protein A2340_10425 [Lentisphaerae bacterium RIFOXYB12_FULL_60_10]
MNINRWLKWSASLVVGASLALTAVLLSTGCEDDPDMGDSESYFEDNPYRSETRSEVSQDEDTLLITPNTPVVSMIGQNISFKVDGGYTPYTWSVADATRGTIAPNVKNSDSSIYTSLAVAENALTVTDNGGRSATVNINVRGATALQIVPGEVTILAAGADYQFQQVGGVAPYTWASANMILGTINATGAYNPTAGQTGTNTINLVDSAGDVATATVIQE